MLRIAHLETSINIGGQELRILDQIQWLLSKGHSAWLLACEDFAIYKEATRRGLPFYPIAFRGSLNPQAISEIVMQSDSNCIAFNQDFSFYRKYLFKDL